MREMIIGAGLSGLIAASVRRKALVHEAAQEPPGGHKALLRFRSDAVANVTGVPFRRVRVTKGIWYGGEYVAPGPRYSNMYSQKVISRYEPRSIESLAPVDRWVAPEVFYERLVDGLRARIVWDSRISLEYLASVPVKSRYPVISTVPMNALLRQCDWVSEELPGPKPTFRRAERFVERYRLMDCDLHQTIYFPDPATSLYRASITGNLLIAEYVAPRPAPHFKDETWLMIASAFGLHDAAVVETLPTVAQQYGKIVDIDPVARRRLLVALTRRENIYSLGRFATWRNILLDDVVKDIDVIKQLIQRDDYGRALV